MAYACHRHARAVAREASGPKGYRPPLRGGVTTSMKYAFNCGFSPVLSQFGSPSKQCLLDRFRKLLARRKVLTSGDNKKALAQSGGSVGYSELTERRARHGGPLKNFENGRKHEDQINRSRRRHGRSAWASPASSAAGTASAGCTIHAAASIPRVEMPNPESPRRQHHLATSSRTSAAWPVHLITGRDIGILLYGESTELRIRPAVLAWWISSARSRQQRGRGCFRTIAPDGPS